MSARRGVGRRNSPSCRSFSGVPASVRGTKAEIAARASAPMPATAQKVARHPKIWPSQVPNGRPRTVASVSPVKTVAMGRGLAMGRHDRLRHDRSRTKKGAMGDPREHPCRQDQREARREGAKHVPCSEDRHDHHQHSPMRQTARCDRQKRAAESDAERIARDQQPGRRQADAKVACHLREQPHNNKFRKANGKGTDAQGNERGRSRGYPHLARLK